MVSKMRMVFSERWSDFQHGMAFRGMASKALGYLALIP